MEKQSEQFELLLQDLSTKFGMIHSEEIDAALQEGLRRILDFLDMDRGTLMEFGNQGVNLIQTYERPGVATVTQEVLSDAKWYSSKMLRAEPVILGHLPDDLPEEAQWEREYCLRIGLRAICSIPIFFGGSPFGVISAASFRHKYIWPEQVVRRIQLLGDLFAGAVIRKRNEQEIRDQLEKLQNQYEFEKLISDLSSQFVNIQNANLDHQIERSLEQLTQFFHMDRMALLKVSPDKQVARVTHSANAEGIPAAPVDINYVLYFPWHTKKLLSGESVCGNVKDLPPEAEIDRRSSESMAIRSNLVIPLMINESVEYVFAVNAVRSERAFETEMIPRIRMLGETFANALTRRLIVNQVREAELEAQRHRQELAHVSRISVAGELAASIAHEINQPLTGILSNAQAALRFLSRDSLSDREEIREILTDIIEDDKRAGAIIRKLRSMVQKGDAEFVPLNMNDVIREVAGFIKSDLIIRNVQLTLDLADPLREIRGDRIQLQQVLLNLILNSLDAVEDESGDHRKVIVRTQEVDDEQIFVAVSDFGKGIKKEEMDKIFEPFYTTKRNGMGMGLSISHTIIKAHDGNIWAENNQERGATFFFTLPTRF